MKIGALVLALAFAVSICSQAATISLKELREENTRTATFVVAASGATKMAKRAADYLCDGTDDQVEIQAAIDALPAGGGKIALLEGNYSKSNIGGISLTSNTEIYLVAGATIKLADGINADAFIFTNSDKTNGNENIIIRGGILDCNSAGQTSGAQRAIDFEKTTKSLVDSSIKDYNHLEYKMEDCKVDFRNRNLMHPPVLIDDCESTAPFGIISGVMATSTDRRSGDFSIKVTANVGAIVRLQKDFVTPIDFMNYQIRVWLKVENPDNIPSFYFRVYSADLTRWGSAPFAPSRHLVAGKWYLIVLSVVCLRDTLQFQDLSQIGRVQFYVQSAAGKQAIFYVDRIELIPIPPKPVVTIILDDAYDSSLDALYILSKYDVRGGLAIPICNIGTGGYLTETELVDFARAGWDLMSHAFSHPDLTSISSDEVDYELIQSKVYLDRLCINSGSDFFVFPYNASNGETMAKVNRVYTDFRNTESVSGTEPSEKIIMSIFGRRPQWVLRVDDYTTWTENDILREALALHDWIILVGHIVDADLENVLEEFCQYCDEQGIEIKTFSEIYGKDRQRVIVPIGGITDHFQDCLAASTNYVHVDITGTGAEQEITTGITNPDVPRNISITNSANSTGDVTIEGIDAKGNSVSEAITIVTGGTAYGDVAFSTVTKIIIPATVVNPDTIEIGMSDKLGLSNVIYVTGDVYKVKKNNADATIGTVDATNDTVDCATITGADDFTIYYRSNLNIIE